MRHTYHAEQWLPYPIETVFDFFANPDNLPKLMPPWQDTRIETSSIVPPPFRPYSRSEAELSIAAGKGTRMTISFRPLPFLPLRSSWDAEITDFEWDDHFCDVQHRGPFAFWRHCHRLDSQLRGVLEGTLVRDHVEYELPYGSLGDLAHRLFIKRQMESIFAYRQRRVAELLPQLVHQA